MSDTESPMQSEMSRRDITLFSFQFLLPLGIAIALTALYFTDVSKNTITLVAMIVFWLLFVFLVTYVGNMSYKNYKSVQQELFEEGDSLRTRGNQFKEGTRDPREYPMRQTSDYAERSRTGTLGRSMRLGRLY